VRALLRSIAVGWLLRGFAFILAGVPFSDLYWAHLSPCKPAGPIVITHFTLRRSVLYQCCLVLRFWRGALDASGRDSIGSAACGMTDLKCSLRRLPMTIAARSWPYPPRSPNRYLSPPLFASPYLASMTLQSSARNRLSIHKRSRY